MSGHADEAVGEQQAGVDDSSFTSHPQGTIKYSNGILLEGRGRRKFLGAGQKLGVAGSSKKRGGI